jgi:hypothetical protein
MQTVTRVVCRVTKQVDIWADSHVSHEVNYSQTNGPQEGFSKKDDIPFETDSSPKNRTGFLC